MFSSRWLRIGIHLWPFRFWLCFPFLKLDLLRLSLDDGGSSGVLGTGPLFRFSLVSFGGEAQYRRGLLRFAVSLRTLYLHVLGIPVSNLWDGRTSWRRLKPGDVVENGVREYVLEGNTETGERGKFLWDGQLAYEPDKYDRFKVAASGVDFKDFQAKEVDASDPLKGTAALADEPAASTR